jgi:hypothetical protein
VDAPVKPKRHRRTKAQMQAARAAEAAAGAVPSKPKRHRRTKAQMQAARLAAAEFVGPPPPPKQKHRKHHRATKVELEARRKAIYDIVQQSWPMTARQVYYQATVHGIVSKDQDGYSRVQRDLTVLRRSEVIPYDWIVDNTRRIIRPYTCSSPREALQNAADGYRKSLWDGINAHVEIWIEKDALSGVISPVTDKYDVPLMVARGYSSLSFLHKAATAYSETEREEAAE